MSKILVTGATGFIGSHLCERMVREGHNVHGTWRHTPPAQDGGMRWWRVNLKDFDAARSLVRTVRPDIIFHLAGRVTGSRDLKEVPRTFQDILTSGINIMSGAAETGCARVVLAGSGEEPRPDEAPTPCSPYAAAKCSSTTYGRMFESLFHMSVVVPRIFMAYGPGQQDPTKLVPYTILSLLRGESPRLTSGQRKVDWIYIDDVIEGMSRAAFSPNIKESTFDLGSGSQVSIREVVGQIVGIIGNGIKPDFGTVPDRALDKDRIADTTSMERAFHWKPMTTLQEGLAKTVEWYRRTRDVAAYVASVAFWTLATIVPDLTNLQDECLTACCN